MCAIALSFSSCFAEENTSEYDSNIEEYVMVTHVTSFLFMLFALWVLLFVLFLRWSLQSSACPGTHFIDQAGLRLRDPPPSASQCWGLSHTPPCLDTFFF